MPRDNLWIVRAEIHDVTAAAAIFLRFGRKIHYWMAMSNEDGYTSGAPTAIVWKAIEDASAQGDTVLDMGGGGRRLSVFKSGFQAKASPYFVMNRWNSRWAKAVSRLAATIHGKLA